MLRTRVQVVALGALCSVAVVAAAQGAASGPNMVVPEKIKDVGTVAQGEVVEVDFRIVNEGGQPLQVKAVRPTCGCTVADYDEQIAAGAEGMVKAKLDTKDFSGPISKSILIMTNDPREPTVSVVIKADVRPFVEVLPRPLIRFNAVQREPMSQKVVVVATEPDRKFEVEAVESSVPFLEPAVRKLSGNELISGKPGQQYEVSLALAKDAPVGPVSAQLAIMTDHPKAEKVVVKVYGVIRAMINVTPTQVQFGTVDATARPGRNLIVVNNRTGNAAMEIGSMSLDNPAFDTSLTTIEEGRRYQVTVKVKEDASPGDQTGTLTIATNDPEFPELTVPVKATVR
jgi:hypothetical protein